MTAVMAAPGMSPAIHISNPELDAWESRRGEATEKEYALERQAELIAAASIDATADTRTLRVVAQPASDAPAFERVIIEVNGSGPRIAISDAAHDQFSEKLGIPKPYYRRMLNDQPGLLAVNMNRWLTDEPKSNLLRMLTPYTPDHEATLARTGAQYLLRAFLGASYRPLDNAQLLNSVIPAAREAGAWLSEFSLDEQRLHARFLTARRNTSEVSAVNEAVAVGFYIRNSETGFASLDVAGFMEILKCLNGMIGMAQTKVRHVGSRRTAEESGDLSYLSSQTQRLDNAAIFSRVTDTVKAALDDTRQKEMLAGIAGAKTDVLLLTEATPRFEFIGNIAKNLVLNETETEVLREEVMRSTIEEGGLTRFAVAQGVTALARESTSFDRRVELERAGWTIISNDTSKLLAAGRVSTGRKN